MTSITQVKKQVKAQAGSRAAGRAQPPFGLAVLRSGTMADDASLITAPQGLGPDNAAAGAASDPSAMGRPAAGRTDRVLARSTTVTTVPSRCTRCWPVVTTVSP